MEYQQQWQGVSAGARDRVDFVRNVYLWLMVGIAVGFSGGLAAAIFHMNALSLVISGVLVIACSAKLLWDTSAMLRTRDFSDPAGSALSLFVNLYVIFISLLNILSGRRRWALSGR